ncbi:MAG: phospholipase/Carboxylesterase [Actinomycetia bacterium]|nr:phospholipase/Carboxylesterase [Actinomycetes bacterium]
MDTSRAVTRTLIALGCAGALLAACGSSTTRSAAGAAVATSTTAPRVPATTTVAPAATAASVQRITVTFVDHSRPTVDPNGTRSAPTRTLPTDIYIPPGAGPFPLIVHAHGSQGHPRKFQQLLRVWARHHYVVAAPAFPLSNDRSGGPTVVGDYVNQAVDMHVVITRLLRMSGGKHNALSGKIDPQHVGVSGLSLGGATVYGVAFNDCCRDAHIDAAIVMSGIKLPFDNHPFQFAGTPFLMFHGDADPTIPYATAAPVYTDAAPPKYFVTLLGAGHAPPYEDTPDPHDKLVFRVTLDFWDAYLRGNARAVKQLVHDANAPLLASIQYVE